MLLPIRAVGGENKIRKNGTALVFFQYCYCATMRTLLNTQIAIPIEYWDIKQRCILANR